MARFSLFKALSEGVKAVISNIKSQLNIEAKIPEPKASEELQYIEQRETEWQSQYTQKLERLKEKYKPLFKLAHTKYSALEKSGTSDYSSAYQNAGSDFTSNDDIADMGTLFREVARAQTFVKDPMSNIEVIKQMVEDNRINIYVGRGKGTDDMKNFWSAVNRAKETSHPVWS